MPVLSAKTARARSSLKTSAHNQIIAKHTNGNNSVLRSKHKHGGLSHGQSFSLHGVHRTVIGVGRYYHHTPSYTLHKDAVPRGHGGSHGTHKISIVKGGSAERCATNEGTPLQIAATQTTSLNKHSDLQTRHAALYHGTYPNRWVQHTRGHMTAEEYILKITEETACANSGSISMNPREYDCNGKCSKCETTSSTVCCDRVVDTSRRYRPAQRKKLRADSTHTLFKLLKNDAMPQSEYIKTRYMRKQNLPTPANRQHFPTNGMSSSCGSSSAIKTWQEAKALGRLPADYRAYR